MATGCWRRATWPGGNGRGVPRAARGSGRSGGAQDCLARRGPQRPVAAGRGRQRLGEWGGAVLGAAAGPAIVCLRERVEPAPVEIAVSIAVAMRPLPGADAG